MTRLERITTLVKQARLQKRQGWILCALIDMWSEEARIQLNWNQRVESWVKMFS
jgi:hypothetical protein